MATEENIRSMEAAMSYRVRSATIGENLSKALAHGDVALHEDGTWEVLVNPFATVNWRFGGRPPPFPCGKLIGFLFRHAYGHGAVPLGCRTCYKVQIKPRTLRELSATLPILESVPHASKAGTGLGAQYHSGVYSALFYLNGLEEARSVYKVVRDAVDRTPKLGPDVPVAIKRGCTEYEVHCGPSDRFSFDQKLEPVEAFLLSRLRPLNAASITPKPHQAVFMRWIQVAYQVGDDTYRDFTDGRRLYPATVAYDPNSGAALSQD
ncbi:hypothetical protein ACFSM5_17490 [Lacibacterium aquatile]|uniref:Uncharacterized protein n=1 Tax=Lacibacterium aquatile TaxID=1168082 RepID=A0ABW5DU90_9PROT